MRSVPRTLFLDSTHAARALLGCRLVRTFPDGRRVVGRIVETEAYPPGDPSSHCFRGSTPRCAPMFARPGTVYVYKIYGMYRCLNVSTEREGTGAAILVRGLDGVEGCDGPSKLCRALEIDVDFNWLDALAPSSPVRVVAGAPPPEPVVVTTRIGLSKAADWPLRFYLLGSPGVSRRDRGAEALLAGGR